MDIVEQETRANNLADLTFEMFELCNYKLEKMARSLNLNISEYKTLQCFKNEVLLSAGELAKRLDLSNSRLTKIIDGLVDKELVDRGLSVKDRRVMEIILTNKGKKVIEKLKHEYTSTHVKIVKNLPEDSIDSVLFAMKKLISATKKWEEN
jgi:MarR family transcriptional regulator, organic hydroperoxide resistance regulator